MAITQPVMYAYNALGSAILTLGPDGAVAGKGVERLADHDIGLESEDTDVAGTRTWHADRGVGTLSTIAAWLFAGAAYTGVEITLESSADDADWGTPRAVITPTADVPQRVVLETPSAHRYWRWTVEDPPAPVRFTEVFLSDVGLALQFHPAARLLRDQQMTNVTRVESASGRAWAIKRGARRWASTYVMLWSPDTDRVKVQAFLDAIEDGAKPFWLLAVTGELRWVRLAGDIDLSAADMTLDLWDIPIPMVEELA